MKTQIDLQNLLRARFLELRTKNPAFSLRSFAKRLGIPPGTLSEVLAGKRRPSLKTTSLLLHKLACDADTRAQILGSYTQKRKAIGTTSNLELNADQFRLIADWVHFGILGLLSTGMKTSQPELYGLRLGVSAQTADQSIQRLIRLGLIEKTESGHLKRTVTQLQTTDDIAEKSVQDAHFQIIELERKALENYSVDLRDFTAMTVPMHPALLGGLKDKVRAFQDDVLLWTKSESETKGIPQSEVFQFCVRIFPLTQFASSKSQQPTSTKEKIK